MKNTDILPTLTASGTARGSQINHQTYQASFHLFDGKVPAFFRH